MLRDRCLTDAAAVAAEAFDVLYAWPLDEAAARSRRPHESHEDARLRIAARRAAKTNSTPVARMSTGRAVGVPQATGRRA